MAAVKKTPAESFRMIDHYIHLRKNQCLDNDNPKAHYIEVLNQYFYHRKSIKRLNHLHQSANGNYDKDTYLYGILMFCIGNFEEGTKYLDKLS